MVPVLLVAIGFGAGSIPFGFLLARRMGIDIQSHGSGNIGATNVARVLGVVPGLIVLVLDATKGALPVAIALHVSGEPWIVVATGLAAIAGHCFSPFLGGKGGKGVATAFGVFLVLVPKLVLVAIAVFVIVLRLGRVPALGSLAGMAALTTLLVLRGDTPFATAACITTLLLVYTHRTNLAKLWAGRRV
ncbi:MAG TPA: glycerol-3-phosphate acyltransferase [Kofleriaceae bacterium]|nr:glycerol-3-phosphate acyltransferase [Kofleriaceae bacterium]